MLQLDECEKKIDQLITAHNEVARLSENLADTIVHMSRRIDKLERFMMRNINATK